jgi:hypothetical protein
MKKFHGKMYNSNALIYAKYRRFISSTYQGATSRVDTCSPQKAYPQFPRSSSVQFPGELNTSHYCEDAKLVQGISPPDFQ